MNELDKNKLFPNQNVDGDFSECCGISVADVVGNMLGIPCDPDFSYAAGFKVMGQTPTTAGEDPDAATDGAIAFGVLPASDETFTALSSGEAYVMQFNNYTPQQRQEALKYAVNGKITLYSFQEIWDYLQLKKGSVVLPITFWSSFFNTLPGGILPPISGISSSHCTAAYDTQIINGIRHISVKMWLGKMYGDGGYAWLSESIFNQIFAYGKAFAFNPDANRFISLLIITAKQFPWFLQYVPQIIAQKKTP